MTGLRVATWNLWWRFGDPDRRHRAIVAELRALDADVVGLQEVWCDEAGLDLAHELADELGMHAAFGPSPNPTPWTDRIDGPSYGIGTAVLARWPVRDVRAEGLPSERGREWSRMLTGVVVDTPLGSCHVQSAHLTSEPTGSALRCEQVLVLTRRVVEAPPTDLPPLVLGDFNAEADADEMRLLEGYRTVPAEDRLLLLNARRWAADPDAATYTPANAHVAPTGSPPVRIDHVLVGLDRGTVRTRVGRVALFGQDPRDGVVPSDHYGIVVDLEVGG